MEKLNAVDGLDILKSTNKVGNVCEASIDRKSTKQSHPRCEKSITKVLQVMHTELSGPVNPEGLNGENFMHCVTDDYSSGIWVPNLKKKSEVANSIKSMLFDAQL